MDFLKEILGEELFNQFKEKVDAFNGDEANKDKQIKLGNLASGEYVGKGKHDAVVQAMASKDTELANANNLIAELKKASKGNEDIQKKVAEYETTNAQLQAELADTEKRYAFDILLMDAGVKDRESREFLVYKHEKKLKEDGKTLELDENKHIKGADDIISSLKITNPTMFESASAGGKKIEENKLGKNDDHSTMTRADILKMPYAERAKYASENPEAYSTAMNG